MSIYIDGRDFTDKIVNWSLSYKGSELLVTITYRSGAKYSRLLYNDGLDLLPDHVLKGNILVKDGTYTEVNEARNIGNKYVIVYFKKGGRPYYYKGNEVQVLEGAPYSSNALFQYFENVIDARINNNKQKQGINKSIQNQFKMITPYTKTALNAYITGRLKKRGVTENLIFPFSLNENQMIAVERAFSSQVSLIEGPPGTGKTQTILNIIANILVRGQTVAIVSSNNKAVENVYEKLAKEELDYLVAKLGKRDNISQFFEKMLTDPPKRSDYFNKNELTKMRNDLQRKIKKLKNKLSDKNKLARYEAELQEFQVEQDHLLKWSQNNRELKIKNVFNGLKSTKKLLQLMVWMKNRTKTKIKTRDRVFLFVKYGIWHIDFLQDAAKKERVLSYLQRRYYDLKLRKGRKKCKRLIRTLGGLNFDRKLSEIQQESMKYLKSTLSNRNWLPADQFSMDNYKNSFQKFMKRFPVIGSSSFAILSSLKKGYILDYVIIDEASQQDIVPGILALSCAKNVVVVGDRKQLPHILTRTGVESPNECYDCEKYSLLDSFIQIFKEKVQVTLLKEHYRCDPRIIQFCNQQFYGGQLIPMTKPMSKHPLKLIITARGNHERSLKNYRELESYVEAAASLEREGESQESGFLSPFRAQINLSGKYLSKEFVRDTVHKFQGREVNEIVFSTVLDKKQSNQKKISFVDDPHLVNVAVSRAKKSFTLVTGSAVFSGHNESIAALIRYIKYYGNENDIIESKVVSSFDLLYSEYDQSLERLRKKLRISDSLYESEQIAAALLRDLFETPEYQMLTFHKQVRLNQVVNSYGNQKFTKEELTFLKQGSSCDFVIYFKVGKQPIAVIEVDGFSHDTLEQKRRDALKDTILHKSDIYICRLHTAESGEKQKIIQTLQKAIQS